jgi:hypothetical protein
MGLIDSVDTMVLGAKAYDQAQDHWPYAEDQGEYGEKLNNLTKFVTSSKLDAAHWRDLPAATMTRGAVATVRGAQGVERQGHLAMGKLEPMHSLLDAGVVDEAPVRPACATSPCTTPPGPDLAGDCTARAGPAGMDGSAHACRQGPALGAPACDCSPPLPR